MQPVLGRIKLRYGMEDPTVSNRKSTVPASIAFLGSTLV